MSLLLSPRAPFVCSLSFHGVGEELGWRSGVAGVGGGELRGFYPLHISVECGGLNYVLGQAVPTVDYSG